ncbi:MAG: hypothetical protein ACUVSS_16115 [Anaerolineae bacterium]
MQLPLGGVIVKADTREALYRGAIYMLGSFAGETEYIPPSLEAVRAWALGEVERRREEDARAYMKSVYAIKVRAAERVLAGTKTAELELEAAARGITQAELAQQILQAAVAAAREIDRIEAWAYRARAAIKKAQTIEQIIAVLAEEEA